MNQFYQCPYDDCATRLAFLAEKAGKKARCPKCERKFITPAGPDKPARLPTQFLVTCERCGRRYWPGKMDLGLCQHCIELESKSARPPGRHEVFDQAALPTAVCCSRCGKLYRPSEADRGRCPNCAEPKP